MAVTVHCLELSYLFSSLVRRYGHACCLWLFQVPLSKKRLNSDDVFILDLGMTIYQWNGNGSNKDERFKVRSEFVWYNKCVDKTDMCVCRFIVLFFV